MQVSKISTFQITPKPISNHRVNYTMKPDTVSFSANIFNEDDEYRKNLLKNAGLNPIEHNKLRPIIGSVELKEIMAEFNENESVYCAENVPSQGFRANLHMHTKASDGALSVEQLLDKAVDYANKSAKVNPKTPFVVAITDHDTTESTKKAIDLVYKDPDKYRNLKIILGTEITAYEKFDDGKNKMFHTLVYNIDPNEKTFSNFIEQKKKSKQNMSKAMIAKANKICKKDIFSFDEAKTLYNPLNKGFVGTYNYVLSYLGTKYILSEILDKKEDFGKIKEHYKKIDGNNKSRTPERMVSDYYKEEITDNGFFKDLNEKLSEFKIDKNGSSFASWQELFAAVKNQPQAIAGIAHPLDYIKRIDDPQEQKEFIETTYENFKKAGKDKAVFSEAYYQSYRTSFAHLKDEYKDLISDLSEKLDLYKTGSQDTHGQNIFGRY